MLFVIFKSLVSRCPHKSIKSTTCIAAGSFETIRILCNGKNSCNVTASTTVFGDPCYGTFKYVEMVYLCDRSPWTEVTVCEHNRTTIQCDDNQEIVINHGFYGRTDKLEYVFTVCVESHLSYFLVTKLLCPDGTTLLSGHL